MLTAAIYDTKSYDRDYFERAPGSARLRRIYHEFRLTNETTGSVEGAQAVCVFVNDHLDAACLQSLQKAGVRLVALRCAGFNNVDLPAARQLGLTVVRVPAYSPHAVAEYTVGLVLTLNRKIHRAYNRVREHNFSLSGLVGFDICCRTVGVVGTGKIGRIVAQIFRGFQARVIAYDPFPTPEWAREHGIAYAELDSVLAESDILTLHVPLTPDTHHLLNDRTLAQLKPGAFVVNTSRGKLIDTTALIKGLKNGHLGGVALDVYEEEEAVFFEDHSSAVLQDDELTRLLTFPNVLITSHQAFLTDEALNEIARVTTENILRLDSGQPFLEETTLE
jgi:D-lactate dehydrogenase